MTKKYHFDCDGRYTYGFTSSGFFTLINRDGESLFDEAVSLCEKLGSHLIWIILWIALMLVFNSLIASRLFMSLIFFHLFLFGCRLTTLMIKGGFKAVLFPPLWVRITRDLKKGAGIALLKKHHLESHPGLLVNLALVQFSQNQINEGRRNLSAALSHCPDHPQILEIFNSTCKIEFKASAQLS